MLAAAGRPPARAVGFRRRRLSGLLDLTAAQNKGEPVTDYWKACERAEAWRHRAVHSAKAGEESSNNHSWKSTARPNMKLSLGS